MKKIAFYFFLFFEKLISLLPFAVIYKLSDFIYFVLKYLVKYRKDVILNNLRNSFPDKTMAEIYLLKSKFLKIMADLIVESLKAHRLSEKNILQKFEFRNLELLNKLKNKGKSVFLVCGHTGSWELSAMIMPLITDYKVFAIYQPQTNPYFDAYIKKIRGSFGLQTIPSQQAYRKFIENKDSKLLNFIVADQSPSKEGDNHWTTFLNQETAFFTGLEKMSKSLDSAVVFLRIIRKSRGKYVLEFELITETPKDTLTGEISEQYARALERLIMQYPENWLWSHKRWKHKKNTNHD